MSNKEKYTNVFMSIFGMEKDKLNEGFNFKDIDSWDSFTHLTLIGELEDAFDVMFESEDILHFGGYLNGMEILKKYGIDFEE